MEIHHFVAGAIPPPVLSIARPAAQIAHFCAGGFPLGVTVQAFLASFQERFGPAVIQIGVKAFPASGLCRISDAVFAAQPFQNNPDLFF